MVKTNYNIEFKGIPASNGIAIGNVFIIKKTTANLINKKILPGKVEKEIFKFEFALAQLIEETNDILKRVSNDNDNVTSIIESSGFILNDPFLKAAIIKSINDCISAEASIVRQIEFQKQFFINAKDAILRERAYDLDNIKGRLVEIIRNKSVYKSLPDNCIIISNSITPAEIVQYREKKVSAIITEVGGLASHTCILARSFEIPAIVGVKSACKNFVDGEEIIADGFSGTIYKNLELTLKRYYINEISHIIEHKKKLGELVQLESKTIDGRRIKLKANIDALSEIAITVQNGAEGFGLVRSESILLNKNRLPKEEEQYKWYKEIADRAFPYEATIRVFDFGSDKFSLGLSKAEDNPALGLRGIRLLLSRQDIFETQIRAILRASSHKNIQIMLPMITNLSELLASKEIIKKVMLRLDEKNIDYDKNIKIGVMIETPSSVLIAKSLAKNCDFFSIGTNDLTQYVLAADRTNEFVSDIYDAMNYSVLKMIKMTLKAAKKQGIPVSICGELAGHSAATELLVGMGISELSLVNSALLETKKRILKLNYETAQKDAIKFMNDKLQKND